MWKFLVKNQSIEILEREILADHQIQYVQFRFTFDGDWKRFHKVVQFSQCDEVYSIVLGTDGVSCYLPAELHVGAVKMSVFGYDTESDETVRATTVPVTLNIRASGFEGEEPPVPPTPDLYQQLIKKIEDTSKGDPGKSAYEIAVDNGYAGTEEEWLESLHGADGKDGKDGITPDMSEYPKTSEVTTIVQEQIAPVVEESHSHDNKATLDSITPELFQELYALQQFEDGTKYDIQTLNEAVDNIKQGQHTHDNKTVLDTITEQYMQEQAAFEASTANALHGLSTGLSEVSAKAHSHSNKAVLDSITAIDTHLDESSSNPVANYVLALAIDVLNVAKHSHDNVAVLDKITEELVTAMQKYGPFEDWTREQIHTLNELLNNFSNTAHTHENKAVLDNITQEMLDDMSSILAVVGQAHWHHNLTTLNGITESHVTRWNETYVDTQNLKERIGVDEGVFSQFKTEILYDVQGVKTSLTEHNSRISALETALSGVEEALANIVEVTA